MGKSNRISTKRQRGHDRPNGSRDGEKEWPPPLPNNGRCVRTQLSARNPMNGGHYKVMNVYFKAKTKK